jgi:hypothetical protein
MTLGILVGIIASSKRSLRSRTILCSVSAYMIAVQIMVGIPAFIAFLEHCSLQIWLAESMLTMGVMVEQYGYTLACENGDRSRRGRCLGYLSSLLGKAHAWAGRASHHQ